MANGKSGGGMKRMLEAVRKKVTPSPQDRREIGKVIDRAVAVTKDVIKPLGLGYTLAGSFIRDTWMPDKKEFEIFIMFPESTTRKELEEKGLSIGKSIVKRLDGSYVIAYAEHPYVRAKAGGFDIDIVPCYRLKSALQIKSAVDRTPFHNMWIEKNLKPGMSGEVRLLKRFAKALGVYGSDTRVQGFSGYLCELLIVRYGSFERLARAAASWEPGMVFIDPEAHHKAGEIPGRLMQRFKGQPIVVIDPVDPNRNVAAAFSPGNFEKFVLACASFLKKPSERFFFPAEEKIDPKGMRKRMDERGSKFLLIQFKRPDVIDDVLWPQLRRTASRLKDIMHEYDFLVIDWAVHSNTMDALKHGGNSYMMLEMGVWMLPKIRKVTGPPIFIKSRAAEFRRKYERIGKVWVEGDRLAAEVRREFLDARAKLEDTLSDPLKRLKAKGIASHIAGSIARGGFKIMEEEQVLDLAVHDKGLGLFLKKYLERGI